jgi:ParB family chromosome partitioning protein
MSISANKPRLGKGLSAIFADEDPLAPDTTGLPRTLALTQIYPNAKQPRRHFDTAQLDELAASIREKGVLQPLLVRPHPAMPNAYEIVAGERRWRAAQLAKIHDVPVIVREIKDAEALEFAIIENVQRADLSPMEEAESYQRLVKEFSRTQEELAEGLGKSRAHISNMLRLNSLPDGVKDMLREGSITTGHARAILAAKDPLALAKEIHEGNLSVRQAETLAKVSQADTAKGKANAETYRTPRKGSEAKRAVEVTLQNNDADILHLQREISTWLGLKVKLNQHPSGAGALIIDYQTLDQLEDVLKRLSVAPKE